MAHTELFSNRTSCSLKLLTSVALWKATANKQKKRADKTSIKIFTSVIAVIFLKLINNS